MQNNKYYDVVLITFGGGGNLYNTTVMSIAAYLREREYKVSIVNCINEENATFGLLSEGELNILSDHCKGVAAIGISVFTTHYLNRAIQINDFLKRTVKAPIIWGGTPIICEAEFYLKYTDYVCTREGEVFMDELLKNIQKGEPIEKTKGLAYKNKNGEIIRTPSIPLVDINEIPLPLFDLGNHFVLNKQLISLQEDPSPLDKPIPNIYRIFPIRGCPFKCTYCSNNKIAQINKGQRLIRVLRNDLVIKELLEAKKINPNIEEVWFREDDFFVRSEEQLEDLFLQYQEKVNLPIKVLGTIKNINEDKINIVQSKNIPIGWMKIGLQSPSKRVLREVYKRPFNKNEFIEKVQMLCKRGVPLIIDLIHNNPYETKSDKIEALDFYLELSKKIARIKDVWKKITLLEHKLTYYPGTELYDRVLQDGIISENYLKETLLTRKTSRAKDFDLDHLIVVFFKCSLRFNQFFMLLMKFLKIPLIFSFLYENRFVFEVFALLARMKLSLEYRILKKIAGKEWSSKTVRDD